MDIIVSGRRLEVTDALRDYVEEKVGAAMKVMNITPLDAEVLLSFSQNRANPRPACCEITLRTKGNIVRVEENEEDMYAAIDVAAAKAERQLRKFKTKVIDRRQRNASVAAEQSRAKMQAEDLDFDELMADLSREDEEIVRVKEMEFPPLTEEEALIQIDLLGHDFFAYTDRDTSLMCVLYRRDNGGYGLLKQKE